MYIQEDLTAKLEKQEQILKQKFGEQASALGDVGVNDLLVPVNPEIPAMPASRIVHSDQITKPPKEILKHQKTMEAPAKTTREKIDEIEAQLGGITTSRVSSQSYVDERGMETWYVKNISGGHVVIADIDGAVIRRGDSVDLLKIGDEDVLRKSRDLRNCLFGAGKSKVLLRLTPEEFLNECEKLLKKNAEVDKIKAQHTDIQEDTKKIRPMVKAKLEKYTLSLSKDKEIAILGLARPDFVEWFMHADLSDFEVDYLMAGVEDTEVRSALVRKKTLI